MLIKVKFAPDTEELADMGTIYVITDNQSFISSLGKIRDYKEMVKFLDDNRHLYEELVKTPLEYDLEFDVSWTMI